MGQGVADDADFHASIRYRVDPSLHHCWDEVEFRRRVARRVGYDPFRDNAPASVFVQIRGSAESVGGQVEWKDANGTSMGDRRFGARDGNCARLVAEMSFAVALQIELLRQSPNPESIGSASASGNSDETPMSPATTVVSAPSAPAPEPAPTPPSLPPPSSPAAPPEPDLGPSEKDSRPSEKATSEPEPSLTAPPADWTMWVGLGPSVAWRISPTATGTGRLFLGIRRNDLSLDLGAEASYPSDTQRWGGSGFRAMLIGGTAGLCGHHSALSGCAIAKASELRVEGLGLDRPKRASGIVAQAGLRLAANIGLGNSWLVAIHLDGLGLLAPCVVELNNVHVLEMPRLSALAGVDLAARFW